MTALKRQLLRFETRQGAMGRQANRRQRSEQQDDRAQNSRSPGSGRSYRSAVPRLGDTSSLQLLRASLRGCPLLSWPWPPRVEKREGSPAGNTARALRISPGSSVMVNDALIFVCAARGQRPTKAQRSVMGNPCGETTGVRPLWTARRTNPGNRSDVRSCGRTGRLTAGRPSR